eukprot:4296367-Pleurochrysis_carterae.AAC.1
MLVLKVWLLISSSSSISTTKNARKAQKRKGEQEVQRTVSVGKGQEKVSGFPLLLRSSSRIEITALCLA